MPTKSAAASNDGMPLRPGQDAPATKTYVDGLRFDEWQLGSGIYHPFECKTSAGCNPAKEVPLWIRAVDGANKVDWEQALTSGKGYIVATAQLRNPDYVYTPLDITGNQVAYLWVGPLNDDGSERGTAFYRIDENGKLIGTNKLTRYEAKICRDGEHKSKAGFKKRSKEETENLCRTVKGKNPRGNVVIKNHSPLWVSCSEGCCDIEQPYIN